MLRRISRLRRRGGGFNPLSLSPVLYIRDLTNVVGGYFIDSSVNGKQIQAATTTTTNDSLIMPANDSQIIAALISAGCYSQFYTNNSSPKIVKLSNISPCYNDYSYYNYFDKKNLMLFPSAQTSNRDKLLTYINTHICYFNSVQGGTPSQVSITYQCYNNKLAYVDYGNWGGQDIQKVNATEIDHTLASVGYIANKTYNIQLFTPKNNNGWKKLFINSQSTLNTINSSHFVGMPLTYWGLYSSGTNHTINSSHFVGMPLTVWKLFSPGTNNTINSSHFVGMPLTYWELYNSGTNHTINSSHFVGMPLTFWVLQDSGTNHIINSSHFVGMPLTFWRLCNSGTNVLGQISDFPNSLITLFIQLSGSGMSITSGILKAWGSATITLQSSYTTASVDGFLINWAPVAGVGTKNINLAGTNGTCTVSDPNVAAAITTLQGKGKTIVIN